MTNWKKCRPATKSPWFLEKLWPYDWKYKIGDEGCLDGALHWSLESPIFPKIPAKSGNFCKSRGESASDHCYEMIHLHVIPRRENTTSVDVLLWSCPVPYGRSTTDFSMRLSYRKIGSMCRHKNTLWKMWDKLLPQMEFWPKMVSHHLQFSFG